MILTCPACDTKYVVKDGAIPPGGRQVRCASCKTAWHQDAEAPTADSDEVMTPGAPREIEAGGGAEDFGGPPMPGDSMDPVGAAEIGDVPALAADEAMVSDYPEPSVEPGEPPAPVGVASFAPMTRSFSAGASYGLTAPSLGAPPAADAAPAAEPILYAEDVAEPSPPLGGEEEGWVDEDHHFISSIDQYDAPNRRGLKIALLLVALVGLAAAALWFVAPDSLKEQIGLADASSTPLEVMLTTSDRQKLASGNELLAISGRVINPTDAEQAVPPIRASLRNRSTRKLVYQWTIAPPARSLPPRGSASFNSAEVDIPSGGDELTVTLGGSAN